MPSKQRVVVVGNGMVGHHFVQQLVSQQGDTQNMEITVAVKPIKIGKCAFILILKWLI